MSKNKIWTEANEGIYGVDSEDVVKLYRAWKYTEEIEAEYHFYGDDGNTTIQIMWRGIELDFFPKDHIDILNSIKMAKKLGIKIELPKKDSFKKRHRDFIKLLKENGNQDDWIRAKNIAEENWRDDVD